MINVLKSNNTIEPFSEEKLLASIKRAGIPSNLQNLVMDHVKGILYENIPTSEIYKHIQEYLGNSNEHYSRSKYSLKRAIMELGPTGFPFEVFISFYLQAEGYATQVGQILLGKCVNHEVDIVAQRGDEKIMVECKFHNRLGVKSDLQVSLYTKSRFDDLKERHGFTKSMLVTNTKITLDALAYADCEGLGVLSWSYPDGNSLRDLAEKHKLFPITQLPFLSISQKQELLARDVVLVSQICKNPNILNELSLPHDKKDQILKEAQNICSL